MKNFVRLLPYAAVAGILLAVVVVAPSAWATSSANAQNQTIPTRTPTSAPATSVPPTAVPATIVPGATPGATPGTTPVPGATATGTGVVLPAGTAAPAGACALATTLTLVSDSIAVAPGSSVVFTATLTNTSRQPLRQIVLEDQLSDALEPGQVISGQATWQGRTLRATAATLAPGAKLVIAYSAAVVAQPGPVITSRASATTAGCPAKTALLSLALPPSELPRTGGSLD